MTTRASSLTDESQLPTDVSENNRALERYYRFHAHIYDLTRWSFLFGRHAIVKKAAQLHSPTAILEVGCGTGKNLQTLNHYFPNASITGIDLSTTMLEKSRSSMAKQNVQVELLQGAYGTVATSGSYDLILFSYALTMFNPGWEEAIEQAYQDLTPGGMIAVVDFHDSRFSGFKSWMGTNHVRMDGHLLPLLESRFQSRHAAVHGAYGGIWAYLQFIGEKS